jgi:UDP-N-acetylmuramoyl-tripeptide--D-alanyl-D-alanine ligase
MGQIAARYADIVVLTSDNPRNEEPLAIIKEMLAGIPDESRAGIYTVPDRREAIERAVSMADRGDVILVAGKGHETFQVRGGKQYHFDDVEEIERACASLGGLNMGGHSLSSGFSASCSASDVVAATGGSLVAGSGNRGFSGVSTDSRSIREGELFWALDGEHFKGSDFVADALGRGAAGAVVGGNGPCDISGASAGDRFVIAVDDTLEALGDFAAWHGRKTGARVIGITGSCGKTGVKELLSMVMSMKYRTLATSGNFNNLIGLPLTLLQAGREHEWVVLEMGMNVPGEIKRLCEIAAPEAGVITSILPAHLEGLGGIEEVCREKSWLWKMMPADGICVLNLDDELCVRAADESGLEDITGYTLERDTAKAEALAARAGAARLVQAVAWKLRPDRTELVLEADRERIEIKSRLSGLVNVRNVLCAASAALALGVEPELVATGIEKAGPVRGRLHVERIGGNVLIDDTYNANPASMAAALEFLGEIKGESRGVAILGDMFELGRDEKRYHLELGERAAATGLDLLVCAGRLGALIAEGAMRAGMAEKRIRVFPDVDSLIKWRGFREMFCAENTALTILVKGSRGMAMERVVKKIQDRRADS